MQTAASLPTGRRGRRPQAQGPALDRQRLVRVLLDLARSGGVDSLNIRSVAQLLGVSPRLIYHHVSSKAEMLTLLTDEILRDRMPEMAAGSWEERLRAIATTVQLAYRDYPGSAAFILSRSANRLRDGHALQVREAIFRALRDAGLRRSQQEELLILFSVVVLGNVMVAESLRGGDGDLAVARQQVESAFARSTDMLILAVKAAASEQD